MPHYVQNSRETAARSADSRMDPRIGVPFDSTEQAWFWFIAAQTAKNDGARMTSACGGLARPCEARDILRIVDGLYRHRCLVPDHLRVLRYYGVRFMPPDPDRPRERRSAFLWQQALARLEPSLIRRGIVRGYFHDAREPNVNRFTVQGVGHA